MDLHTPYFQLVVHKSISDLRRLAISSPDHPLILQTSENTLIEILDKS